MAAEATRVAECPVYVGSTDVEPSVLEGGVAYVKRSHVFIAKRKFVLLFLQYR